MIAAWLRDLLNKARNKEPAPKPDHLPLTDFWINQMLQCEGDCIYEFSRAEPFRLRHVRASDTPITPHSSTAPSLRLSESWSRNSPLLPGTSATRCVTSRRTRRSSCGITKVISASCEWRPYLIVAGI